ncbi:synaptobrevin family protein [Cryptosporidium ryanae]|uniref:synaptobrevin family protein n=1 Tax=Cryptosporidium ryanae TaxID=515981 RepID=UPI00351A5D7E|nr:synaptobrevin family protein [Cryptosporidium ryanae]
MLKIKDFPRQNKNLVFTGLGLIDNGLVIFSWYDRISSIIKDEIDNVYKSELVNGNSRKSQRIKKQISIEDCNWILYIWNPQPKDGKLSYSVCCTCKEYPERIIYTYLKELDQLTSRVEKINCISELRTNLLNSIKDYKQNVKDTIAKFDDYKQFDKIIKLENNIEEIKTAVRDNINIIVQNQGILESLDNQVEVLEVETGAFLSESTKVKNKFWWKNMRYTFILASIITLIITIVIAYIYNTLFGNKYLSVI